MAWGFIFASESHSKPEEAFAHMAEDALLAFVEALLGEHIKMVF